MKPLYIFDLDGTLALIEHRRHFVSGGNSDWRAFFAACVDDKPYTQVLDTLLSLHFAGADIWIWSGRSDEVMSQTQDWLEEYGIPGSIRASLKMRPANDHSPDEKLKKGWLDAMTKFNRSRLVAVFEDRDRMVKLWRGENIACFQVAPGDF